MVFQRAYNFYGTFTDFYDDVQESSAQKRYIVVKNGIRVAYIQTGAEYPAFQFRKGEKVTLGGGTSKPIEEVLKEIGFVTVTQLISVSGGTPTLDD